jgi:hypothetical protein
LAFSCACWRTRSPSNSSIGASAHHAAASSPTASTHTHIHPLRSLRRTLLVRIRIAPFLHDSAAYYTGFCKKVPFSCLLAGFFEFSLAFSAVKG